MRHPRQTVKLDIVLACVFGQLGQRFFAQLSSLLEVIGKFFHCFGRSRNQGLHLVVTGAALVDGRNTVIQRLNQRLAPLGIFQQVILQIRVARHHPQIAQHLKQHAGTAAGFTLGTQDI